MLISCANLAHAIPLKALVMGQEIVLPSTIVLGAPCSSFFSIQSTFFETRGVRTPTSEEIEHWKMIEHVMELYGLLRACLLATSQCLR